jgi:hypothetical protein
MMFPGPIVEIDLISKAADARGAGR